MAEKCAELRVSVLWCAAVGDCSTGASKKACANCTCGRAEEEAQGIKASLTADMLDNPQSACGSVSFFFLSMPVPVSTLFGAELDMS